MKFKGFTLIELVVVIVILGVISAVALPKFINLKTDAQIANLKAMKGAIESSLELINAQVLIAPNEFNGSENRYTLDSGQQIRMRGRLPDGRWNVTFAHLLNFDETAQVNSNNCNDANLKWCVRQRGQGWFNSRGYSSLGQGRGFVIFPNGNNLNNDRCYIYYMNQNDSASPANVNPSIVGIDTSDC
ncbi:prepilin-type N-terminal cleavage/methylation domain-containing protein [Thalassotalea sp. M1531]|uniref:Prepilin-type N-terminal cleavage/methylation domain-containing protein n=1 Tax=Thalassotalea algicola TaxID=2716224 RepID=A0A7Y0Q704_9GAMM|nr:prepilin-type N-terminal cleavage/methylation domain-containing protein [Thalassotalea algicola]NMP32524.1 prepilin-type N-terminal cleavage/methylation domain-containing protein [Thalassotalea algicola]